MIPSKSTSSLLEFALFLFLLLTLLISVYSSEPATVENNDINDGNDDESEFEELIALDEKEDEDQETQESGHAQSRPSETELLSMAQKVVLELNSDKVKTVFHENEFVLVLGYAPWCPRSAELMPNFAEAAIQLKELGSPLLMAKIDAERHPRAAANLGIRGFPTLLLFVNGSSQVYTGGFSADEIVIWVRKRTGVPVTRISSVTEAEELLRRHAMFFIGLFEKFEGGEYEEFLKASKLDNEIQFVEVSSSAVAEVLFPDIKTDNIFLGLVKSEPERYTKYEGTFRADKILEFLDYNKFPLVNILTELKSARVYSSPVKLQVFVFADVDDFNNLFGPLQDIARKFMSKIMFVLVDIREENLAKPFLTLFGLEESKDTVVTAFDNKISSKYLLESAPAPSKIEDFCLGLLSGTVTPYFKSEPIPDNKEEGVQIIVGKTFDSLVLGSPKNILLEVHAPWCFTCDTTSKQILMLAKHFNGSEDIVFAKIDASANEHPELQVHDYPTLLFYPANDKSNPIKLSPKSSLKDLAAFIRKNLKAQDSGTTKDEL